MSDTISISISDYLSKDDMRQIAIDEFRREAKQRATQDFERILDNAAYELVRREVDDVFDGGMAETVKAKAIEVIKRLDQFTVFRRPNAWDRGASQGWALLQKAVSDAKQEIERRVNEIISSMDTDDLRSLVESQITEVISSRLMGISA